MRYAVQNNFQSCLFVSRSTSAGFSCAFPFVLVHSSSLIVMSAGLSLPTLLWHNYDRIFRKHMQVDKRLPFSQPLFFCEVCCLFTFWSPSCVNSGSASQRLAWPAQAQFVPEFLLVSQVWVATALFCSYWIVGSTRNSISKKCSIRFIFSFSPFVFLKCASVRRSKDLWVSPPCTTLKVSTVALESNLVWWRFQCEISS